MDDDIENYINFSLEDEYFKHEKRNIDLLYEGKIEDPKNVSTGENHNPNSLKLEGNIINDNQLLSGQSNIYNNLDNLINIEKNSDIKNLINEPISLNSDVFHYNHRTDQPNLNQVTSTSHFNTVNGRQIITTNDIITNKFQEIFKDHNINIDKISDMQYLRKKKKRRKKNEILKDQIFAKGIKLSKKKGRIKTETKKSGKIKVNHPKDADDNIIKKINTFLIEEIRKWLNCSFLNDNFDDFQTEKFRTKKKKGIFMKLSPKSKNLISTKIKRELILKILDTKFKDIFRDNNISSKYKNPNPNNNKELIDKIYEEKNQDFVIFILEMTFSEGLNFFNGLIPDENIIEYFKKNYNYNDTLINKFIKNFGKIGKLYDKLLKNNDKSIEETKTYFSKINVLCLNYKQSFKDKYSRKDKIKDEPEKQKENGANDQEGLNN